MPRGVITIKKIVERCRCRYRGIGTGREVEVEIDDEQEGGITGQFTTKKKSQGGRRGTGLASSDVSATLVGRQRVKKQVERPVVQVDPLGQTNKKMMTRATSQRQAKVFIGTIWVSSDGRVKLRAGGLTTDDRVADRTGG